MGCPVLLHSRGSSRTPQTGADTQHKFIAHGAGGWNSRSGYKHARGTPSSWVKVADFSLCPHMAGGERELCGVPFRRALIPSGSPTFTTQSPPQSSTPNTITWSLGFNVGLGRVTYLVPNDYLTLCQKLLEFVLRKLLKLNKLIFKPGNLCGDF